MCVDAGTFEFQPVCGQSGSSMAPLLSSKVATSMGCLSFIDCKDGRCYFTCKLCTFYDQAPTYLNSSSTLGDLRKIEKAHRQTIHVKLQSGQKPKKRIAGGPNVVFKASSNSGDTIGTGSATAALVLQAALRGPTARAAVAAMRVRTRRA